LANTQVQFGFQPYGVDGGFAPNFALRRRTIAYNYGTSLFRGDPVASNNAGNIIVASSQTAPVGGIFWGCKYYDPVQKITFTSKSWKAPTLASTQVVEAYIIDNPDQLFLVAEIGSTAAIATANVMNNVQWVAGTTPVTGSDISTFCIDDANITTTITLPFKIMDLYSTFAAPGANGSDDTTVYNWAIVKMNYSDRAYGTIGI
jgi:hypothetical protein